MLLKNRFCWCIKPANNGSRICRKLLHVRELALRYIIHDIGNGANTSLWYNSWLSIGSIVEKHVW